MLAETFGNDWLKIDLPFPCEIHPYQPRAQPRPDRFRVLMHTAEPAPLRWDAQQVRAHHHLFHLILTCDESLLDLPNARFLIFGDAWTRQAPEQKSFSLSFLRSAGVGADWDGYAMRERLWGVRHDVTVPKRYWYSQRRPPKVIEPGDERYPAEGKELLFESMFSLIVENIRETNYFTEKLLDAFQTYTVPVYFGCPNVGNYFDARGMILFEDEREFLARVNALTPQDYWDRLPWVRENHQRSMAYRDGLARVKQAIETAYRHLSAPYSEPPAQVPERKLLVAGDSHAVIFGNNVLGRDPGSLSRLPGVDVLHLGPSLAYTLARTSSLNAGPRLLSHLAAHADRYAAVMLCFGEIDLRTHVIRQAVLQGLSLEEAVGKLADEYLRFVDDLVARSDLPVFLWSPVASMPDAGELYNPDFPTVGTERERNHATALFHQALKLRCEQRGQVHLVSIFEQLVDADLRTRGEYYEDGVHLNRLGMHLAFQAVRQKFAEAGRAELQALVPAQVHVRPHAVLRDVSHEARIVDISSSNEPDWPLPAPLRNPGHLPFVFHTQNEDHPRVLVDLGCVQMLGRIEIFNRRDGFHDRARSLKVGVSTNRCSFDTVFDNVGRQPFGQSGQPLTLQFDTPLKARYIRLSLEEAEAFHLGDVRLWAHSFLDAQR